MPNRRLDVIGKRFGKLTAIEYSPRRSKSKNLFIRCQCDCRGKTGWPGWTETTAADLTRKNRPPTRSCGCLTSDEATIRKRSRLVEEAHAANDVKTFDGKSFLSHRAFMHRLGISSCTLLRWKDSCRFLGGRGISIHSDKGAFQEADYYAEADADKIEKARNELDAIPDLPGKVAVALACSHLGLTGGALAHLLRQNKRRSTREKAGVSDTGRLVNRFYITKALYDSLREKLAWGENDCTKLEAAGILGCALSTVVNLRQRGMLLAQWRYGKHADGVRRKSWVLSRKEVIGLGDARLKRPQHGRDLWTHDPRTEAEKADSRRLPEATRPKRERTKPSRERHLKWQEWRLEGFSLGEIVLREKDESGDDVTRIAVLNALKRLGKSSC